MPCCCTFDEEKQLVACILFHYQCGACPLKCCNYDDDGMCWGKLQHCILLLVLRESKRVMGERPCVFHYS
jgi:hypothetical protein